MPGAVVAAIVGSAVSSFVGGAVASAIGTGFLATAAGALSGGLATSVIGAAFSDSPSQPTFTQELRDNLVTVRQPISHWQYIYGRRRVPGALTFAHESADQHFHLIITYAGHVCDGIESIQFNDEVVPLDEDGNATGKYAGYVRIKISLGDEEGQPFPDLVAESEEKWTDAHRQSGRTKIYVRLKFNADLFPAGLPNITAVIRGKRVYDERTDEVVWSDTPSLCIADYLCDPDVGLGCTYANEIDIAQLIAAANIDEEGVERADETTEARYTLNGAFLVNDEPRAILGRLLTANAGKLRYIGGMWRIHPAAYVAPTITLTEDDLRAVPHVTPRLSSSDLSNRVKGLFISEANYWQPTDFPPVTNATYLEEDGGEPSWRELDLPFTKSPSTAQRIAKIELERMRQQIGVEWPGKFSCYRLQPGDTVKITLPILGWTEKVYEVDQASLVFEGDSNGLILGSNLVLRETAATVYDWNNGEETVVDPAPDTNLPNPFVVAPPSGLTVGAETLTAADGAVTARIVASWTASPDAFVTGYELAWREDGGPWDTMRCTGTHLTLPGTVFGRSYDVRVRAINSIGVRSVWDAINDTIVSAPAIAPSAPVDVSVTGALMAVELAWAFAGARTDLRATEIWWSATNNRSTAIRLTSEPHPSRRYLHPGLSPGVGGYYWLRVLDTYGNPSAWYPDSATAGLYGSPSADPSALLTQLTGALSERQMAADMVAPIRRATRGVHEVAEAEIAAVLHAENNRRELTVQLGRARARILAEEMIRIAADQALASRVSVVEAGVDTNAAAITDEATTRASAVSALASRVGVVEAEVDTNAAAITDEATTRASAVSALASTLSTWIAEFGDDLAAVETLAEALADEVGDLLARWGVKVQVMADGHRAVVGAMSLSADAEESVLRIVADKIVAYRADGTGTPVPVFAVGAVNGVTAMVLNGSLFADGDIVARHLATMSVTTEKINDEAVTSLSYFAEDATEAANKTFEITFNMLHPGDYIINAHVRLFQGLFDPYYAFTSAAFEGDTVKSGYGSFAGQNYPVIKRGSVSAAGPVTVRIVCTSSSVTSPRWMCIASITKGYK